MKPHWKRKSPFTTAAAILTLVALAAMLAPAPADARGRHGGFRGGGFVGVRAPVYSSFHGFYGPGYFGYSPYYYGFYGPQRYPGREGGLDPTLARMQGWGAIDVNVKPKKAEVWVDGRYIGKAGELDGYPSYLWLEEGVHEIVIYKGGFQSYEREIAIHPGAVVNLKLKLESGDSPPPQKEE